MSRQVSSASAEALRKTLLLPQTRFPMRANAAKREPLAVQRLTSGLYRWQEAARKDAPPFVLHDGPPYANGSLHIGHFMNKVLKDIANRSNLLRGKRIEYHPGWDCHGLPIELRALQRAMAAGDAAGGGGAGKKQGKKKGGKGGRAEASAAAAASSHVGMDPMTVRRLARALAQEAIGEQSASFERWGVLAAWDDPAKWYRTMDADYEAAQLGVLGDMHSRGLIHRANKPVYWSPASRTALAEAELEYRDGHVSQAAYVRLPLLRGAAHPALAAAPRASLLVWTTTPWTLPANRAACVNARFAYAVVRDPLAAEAGAVMVVAADLVAQVERDAGLAPGALEVVGELPAAALVGAAYAHPLERGRECPVLAGDHVTLEAGTGIVHTAPGHGHDDFSACRAAGLAADAFAPVDDAGRFTAAAAASDPALVGLEVLGEGTAAALSALDRAGALFHSRPYAHRYPYDWRSKQPVIVRATPQWFASLGPLHESALAALGRVDMVPAVAASRLRGMLEARTEWCISRQRAWGVPIPAWEDEETGEVLLSADTVEAARRAVAAHGSDAWWSLPAEELLPPSLAGRAARLRRCADTLDVWFDSGCSWAAVIAARGLCAPGAPAPSDLYLEGSDQHRGWFQSSLLTHVAARGAGAPFRQLVTHGFVLDERRAKMSKSVGNVVDPADVIAGRGGWAACGADVLRVWVASCDFSHDVVAGPTVVGKAAESLRKLRNTARFCLGNLRDAPLPPPGTPLAAVLAGAAGLPAPSALPLVDRFAVHRACEHALLASRCYAEHAHSRLVGATNALVAADLSAFYCDAVKDALYCDAEAAPRRRAAQAALYVVLRAVAAATAPIAPFTAQDVWAHLEDQAAAGGGGGGGGGGGDPLAACPSTVFEDALWADEAALAGGLDAAAAEHVGVIRALRDAVNAALEPARAAKLVGGSAEVGVRARVLGGSGAEAAAAALRAAGADGIVEMLGVSQGAFGGVGASALLGNAAEALGADMWRRRAEALGAEAPDSVPHGARVVALDTPAGAAEVEIEVAPAVGTRCDRCWRHTAMPVRSEAFGDAPVMLCHRCAAVAGAVGAGEGQ